MIELDGTDFNFNQAHDSGQDIRFTDADGTPLPYEIEIWDKAGEYAAIWVLVPSIDGNSNQDFITMYAGNSFVDGKSDAGAVFNSANGFVGVWHLGEEAAGTGTTGVYKDAVPPNYNGTDYITATGKSGVSGYGQEFDGYLDYIDVPGLSGSDLDSLTLSVWVKPDNQSSWADMISKEDNNYYNGGYGLRRTDTDRFDFVIQANGKQTINGSASSFIDNGTTWYYVTGTYDGETMRLYVDGSEKLYSTGPSGPVTGTSAHLNIGRRVTYSNREINGCLDEVRISKVARSADWVKLCYENQRANSNFISFEDQEVVPVVSVNSLASSLKEEGNATDMFTISATVSVPQPTPMYISVACTLSGTADNGIDYDYINTPITVTIPTDSTYGETNITVVPIDDGDDEGNETITITLLSDTLYLVGQPDSATVYLSDSDAVIPPDIIVHPQSRELFAGDITDFSIEATGTEPIDYQWRKKGIPISGATAASYTTPPVTLSDDSATFDCIASNTEGADTSNPAMITVTERPEAARVYRHPFSATAVIGDTVKFSIEATGEPPLYYQWHTDTGAIAGADSTVLRVGPVTLQDDGRNFHCVVTNAVNSATSRSALLTVTKPSSQKIVVSGELYEADGTPVGFADARLMDFVVRLYPSSTSDSVVYTETFLVDNSQAVAVTDGKFIIRLGEGATADDLQEVVRTFPNLFVLFTVTRPGGNPEVLEPRTPLTASPFALSGMPELLKGEVDPAAAGIEAPIGTHFVNTLNGNTYIKTHNSWAILNE